MADNKPGLLLMSHGDIPGNFFTDTRNRSLYEDCLTAMGRFHQGDHDGRLSNDDLTIFSHSIAASMAGSIKEIEISYLKPAQPGIVQAIANAAAKSPRRIICAGAAGLMIPGHGTLERVPGELRSALHHSPALDIKYTGPWLDTDMAASIVQHSIEQSLGNCSAAAVRSYDMARHDDLSAVLISAPDHSIRTHDDATSEFARTAAMLSNRSSRWHDAGIASVTSDFMENVSAKLRARGFSAVETGYIDFATPGIEDAALRLIDQGASHIVVTGVTTLLHRHPLSIISPDDAVKWLRAMIPYACIRYLNPDPVFVARMLSGHMVSKVLDAGRNGARIIKDH